jgi:hypothetical protein
MTAILSVGRDQMAKRTIILQRAGYLATEVYSRREALRQLRSIRSFRNWVRRADRSDRKTLLFVMFREDERSNSL